MQRDTIIIPESHGTQVVVHIPSNLLVLGISRSTYGMLRDLHNFEKDLLPIQEEVLRSYDYGNFHTKNPRGYRNVLGISLSEINSSGFMEILVTRLKGKDPFLRTDVWGDHGEVEVVFKEKDLVRGVILPRKDTRLV